MSVVEYSPTTPSRIVTILAAMLAFLTTLQGAPSSVGVALLGASTLSLAVIAGSRTMLDVGTGLLFLGIVFAGAFATSPVPPLVGAVATVVAWDAGDTGIGLGDQLSADADTGRLEAVHAGISAGVGLAAAIGAYAVYILAAGNQPLPALVLLLFAAVVLTAAMRD